LARQKNYKSALQSVTIGFEAVDDSIKIDLPSNPRNHRQLDHSQYLGSGFEAWTIQSIYVIRALLQGGNFSVATLIGYSVKGLRFFLSFLGGCLVESPPASPNGLTKCHIGTVSFLCSRHEHLHRCFICVDDYLPKHYFAQRVDQRLQLDASNANPLSQRRTWNRQASSTEDRFLTVKGQMVSELRDHDVVEQVRSRDALINNLRRNQCLSQRFEVIADLLATDMAFDGEHAARVIQLLANVFTDALGDVVRAVR